MVQELATRLRQNIQNVMVGKDEAINLLITAMLCEGHLLIDDVPGTGKTTLARALARSLNCTFRRIQFTPDLRPDDVTGINIFNEKTRDFEFRPGPLLSQIVLADEINRATPRTQSALLEAMQEHQITVDGETRSLPRPFLILATQNPVELEGTFPLPEAQLDRFLLRINIGYPSEAEENAILKRFRRADPLSELGSVVETGELIAAIEQTRDIRVEESVQNYLLQLVRQTRTHEDIALGASPRAALALYRTSQAWAGIAGRSYVLPDDVKFIAPHVLSHRIMLATAISMRGRTAIEVIDDLIKRIPVPVTTLTN